jgi:putative ATP-binding cassette transporter
MTPPTEQASRQDVALGWQTAQRLGNAIRNFATSRVGGRAAMLAGLLLALLLAINGLNVLNSYVARDFMTAIAERVWDAFLRLALLYAGVLALSTITAVIYRFCEERLGLLWRDWLTRGVVDFYLTNRRYQRFGLMEGVENPDQRITDDVRAFTTSTLSLFLIFLNGTFTLIAFSGVLWSISRPLFGAAVIYAACGSLLAIRFGRPLVQLNYDQSDKEATFRATLVHVRENAESIAILHREPNLDARLQKLFDAVTSNLRRIIAVNRNLGFFTTGYNFMLQLIPALLVAPLFIQGTVEFGVIPQASIAFAQVVGAFSVIVNQFPLLSSYGAVLARLSALIDAAETIDARPPGGVTVADDAQRLAFEQLTLRTPRDGRPLVLALSMEVKPASRLLVAAPGDATVSLLRIVAGLEETGEGRIVRPAGTGLVVLPDKPYLPPGTLREVLVGRNGASAVTEHDIHAALQAVTVQDIVDRAGGLDAECDWGDLLSLEEQRLVGIAWGLLAAPRFAVLERLQAGIGGDRAAQVLDALVSRGIGCVVLDHEEAERAHFDAVVEIAADGTWKVTAEVSK